MVDKKLINKIEKYQDRIRELQQQLIQQERKEIEEEKGFCLGQEITDKWAMYNGDCVETMKGFPNDSIHYSIFSPPFLSLYVYSDDNKDMGNSKNDDEFYSHFMYFIRELYRVMMPGRLVSVHCSVIPRSISKDGFIGLKDFPGHLVQIFEKNNFIYHSKVIIWKDPLVQAVRTKNLTLAHKQIVTDSTRCGQGFADEILTFRKPGTNPEPVEHKETHGFDQYIGNLPDPKGKRTEDPKTNKFSHEIWQRYASPVWFDIDQTDTLNVRVAREDKDEKHICPLQLQVIARCLHLWTNKNDVVLSPFAGIGSEGFEAIKNDRKFIGIELKKSYYQNAIKNLKIAENLTSGFAL